MHCSRSRSPLSVTRWQCVLCLASHWIRNKFKPYSRVQSVGWLVGWHPHERPYLSSQATQRMIHSVLCGTAITTTPPSLPPPLSSSSSSPLPCTHIYDMHASQMHTHAIMHGVFAIDWLKLKTRSGNHFWPIPPIDHLKAYTSCVPSILNRCISIFGSTFMLFDLCTSGVSHPQEEQNNNKPLFRPQTASNNPRKKTKNQMNFVETHPNTRHK